MWLYFGRRSQQPASSAQPPTYMPAETALKVGDRIKLLTNHVHPPHCSHCKQLWYDNGDKYLKEESLSIVVPAGTEGKIVGTKQLFPTLDDRGRDRSSPTDYFVIEFIGFPEKQYEVSQSHTAGVLKIIP